MTNVKEHYTREIQKYSDGDYDQTLLEIVGEQRFEEVKSDIIERFKELMEIRC
jgi:hypothetical protein